MKKEAERREKEAERREKRLAGIKRKFEETEEDDAETEDSDPVLSPICTEGIPDSSFWTVLGSSVYCFGSSQSRSNHFNNGLKFFDVFDLEKGGTRGPPMLNNRLMGKAVVLQGNIYVFGGTKRGSFNGPPPWAEVLEACNNNGGEWKALEEPPIPIKSVALFALPYGSDSILVGSLNGMDVLSQFHVSKGWHVIEERFDLNYDCYSEPLLLGNCMYWAGRKCVWAYDLQAKMYLCGRIHFKAVRRALRSVEAQRFSCRLPLIHVGGDTFCLIWDDMDFGRGCRSMFVCYKFRVLRKENCKEEGSLSVKTVSLQYFLSNDGLVSSFDGMGL